MKITKSEIVQSNTADALLKLAENKFNNTRMMKMGEKYGITASKEVLDSVIMLLKRAYVTFGDGVQLSDVTAIVPSIADINAIQAAIPASVKEFGDLNLEEIVELLTYALSELSKVYSQLKNHPVSGN